MKKSLRISLFGCLSAGVLLFAGHAANANVIALVMDGSGSICPHPNGGFGCTSNPDPTADDFGDQLAGYANALNLLLPTDGSNAVGVWQFSNVVQQEFPISLIDSQADKDALIAAILAIVQLGGSTAIGDAVTAASNALVAFAGAGDWIIDVSTDGASNTGQDPEDAVTDALAAGVSSVNCLGIGAAANCDWNLGGLDFAAASFQDFEDAILTKLSQEFITPVPEPATLALFGLGLLGLGFMQRRRAA